MTNQFDVTSLRGIDAAKFNQQQYKMGHLQAWVESEDIRSTSELLKACSAIDASLKVFDYVNGWAIDNGFFGGKA